MHRLRGVILSLNEPRPAVRRRGTNGNDRNMEGYEQIQEDVQEAVDSQDSAPRLSLDDHLEHHQLTLPMNGLVDSRPECTNDIISNEEATRENTTVQNNTHSISGDDMVRSSANPLLPPMYIMGLSTPVEIELLMAEDYYNDRITSLQQRGLISIVTEPISIPTGKENTIMQILTPVTSSVDELEVCFCGAPYADTTSKIENDSHEAVQIPECPHIFGKHCILQWLNENQVPTCPMCRKKVTLARDVPGERMDDQELYRVIDYHYSQPE
ncbi:f443afe7-2670-495e-85e1-91e07d069cdb [Sclerotinia trifoliorum]|uniref:Anaphase-promoting complex subunit 11 n=1 Tax=Sclerotinia trifoliorum TaxID=28548 RepID=A0A8H2VYU3_9HELO|nr:f443afe7-2670-495e-85e1-91e07d069cdb [Sclerotinia trifoliorum]